jgi:MFS family permease
LNAAIVSVTEPRRRTVAFAANIFVVHLLGDAISPTIIGFLSDRWGLRRALLIASLGFIAAAASSFAAMNRYAKDARYA